MTTRARSLHFVAAILAMAIFAPTDLAARPSRQQKAPSPTMENNFRCMVAPNPDMTYMIMPNTSFLTFGVPFTTNEYGFRDKPITPKTSNIFRVLCVGDSVTYGTGAKTEETFPNVLEARMQQYAGPAFQVDVVNGGVSAYNARNVRGLLEQTIDAIQPDVVVYTFVENDLDDSLSVAPGGLLIQYDPAQPLDGAYFYGAIAPHLALQKQAQSGGFSMSRLFSQWFNPIPDVAPPLLVGDHPLTLDRWAWFEMEVQRMNTIARTKGARFLVYVFGTRNHSEPVNRKVFQICQRLGIPYASTSPLFDHRDYMKKDSLGFDPHCNPAALQKMADRLYSFLEDQQALPTVCVRPGNQRLSYDEAIDNANADRLALKSLEAPEAINPAAGEGYMGVMGGLDVRGRMARTCVVRLGGSGTSVEVEASALLAAAGQPQTLSARVEGTDCNLTFNIPAQPVRISFPVPQAFRGRTVEVELIAGGPSQVPRPEERLHGEYPYTLMIHSIARGNSTKEAS